MRRDFRLSNFSYTSAGILVTRMLEPWCANDVNEAAHVNLVKAKVVKLLMKNKKHANKCEDDIADQMVIVTVQKVLSRWLLVWH